MDECTYIRNRKTNHNVGGVVTKTFLFLLLFVIFTHHPYASSLSTYDALNNTSIRDAVKVWLTNSTTATKQYGHIRTWNTSLVTDMSCLFAYWYQYSFSEQESASFNDDLFLWDISRVTTVCHVCRYYILSGEYLHMGYVSSYLYELITHMGNFRCIP